MPYLLFQDDQCKLKALTQLIISPDQAFEVFDQKLLELSDNHAQELGIFPERFILSVQEFHLF